MTDYSATENVFIFDITNNTGGSLNNFEIEFPMYSRHGVELFDEDLGITDIDGVKLIQGDSVPNIRIGSTGLNCTLLLGNKLAYTPAKV